MIYKKLCHYNLDLNKLIDELLDNSLIDSRLISDNADYQQDLERLILTVIDWLYSKARLQTVIRDYLKTMSQVPLMTVDERNNEGRDPCSRVVLEVGLSGDTWKYCVDRQTLAEKSEWFRALLMGGMAPPPSDPPPIIYLQHVDKRAFDHLFRYFCGESVKFNSVLTARSTLDAAHYYLCPELAKLAVEYIVKNLTPSTVLSVYHGLNLYALHPSHLPQSNSCGGLMVSTNDATEIETSCSQLLAACLSVIDSSPDQVLRQEGFEDLTSEEVAFIAHRDDLRLTKESILFKALEKWSASECRRRGMEPTAYNKRSVLSDEIWFSVRYLLMNDREFIHGPMASGILSSEESAAIVARILGHIDDRQVVGNENQPINNVVANRLTAAPRKRKSPVKLKKGMKPGKKEREDNKKNQRKECASQGQQACARVGDFVIRVLACVFD